MRYLILLSFILQVVAEERPCDYTFRDVLGDVSNATSSVCNWTFNPPTTNDTMLLIKIYHTSYYGDEKNDLVMPDGISIKHEARSTWVNSAPWCSFYSMSRRQCGNLNLTKLCDSPVKIATTWPPTIQKTSGYVRIQLSYTFVDCYHQEVEFTNNLPEKTSTCGQHHLAVTTSVLFGILFVISALFNVRLLKQRRSVQFPLSHILITPRDNYPDELESRDLARDDLYTFTHDTDTNRGVLRINK